MCHTVSTLWSSCTDMPQVHVISTPQANEHCSPDGWGGADTTTTATAGSTVTARIDDGHVRAKEFKNFIAVPHRGRDKVLLLVFQHSH